MTSKHKTSDELEACVSAWAAGRPWDTGSHPEYAKFEAEGDDLMYRGLLLARRYPWSNGVAQCADSGTTGSVGTDRMVVLRNGLLYHDPSVGIPAGMRLVHHFLSDPGNPWDAVLTTMACSMALDIRYGTSRLTSMEHVEEDVPPYLGRLAAALRAAVAFINSSRGSAWCSVEQLKGDEFEDGDMRYFYAKLLGDLGETVGATEHAGTDGGRILSGVLDHWNSDLFLSTTSVKPVSPTSALLDVLSEVIAGVLPISAYMSKFTRLDGSDWGWEYWAHLMLSREPEVEPHDWVRLRIALTSEFEKVHPGGAGLFGGEPSLFIAAKAAADRHLLTEGE